MYYFVNVLPFFINQILILHKRDIDLVVCARFNQPPSHILIIGSLLYSRDGMRKRGKRYAEGKRET